MTAVADAVLRGELNAATGDGSRFGRAGQRENAEVDEVAEDVEKQDDAGAECETQRDVAARVLNLAGGEGDVVPRVGAEEAADLHDCDDGEQTNEGGWAADADLHGVGGVPACSSQKLCQPGPKFAAMAVAFLATRPTRTTRRGRELLRR